MTIKAVELFHKKPGMPDDEFYDYWLNEHAKVVLALDGLVRYSQNHPIPETRQDGRPPFDGMVETWFESVEVMRANGEKPYWAEVIADEERFIDRSSLRLLLADEHVIKDGPVPEGGIKTIKVIHRKPGMDVPAFQQHWRETYGPLVANIPGLRRHEQNHARLGAYKAGRDIACDGLGLSWFDSFEAVRAAAGAPEHKGVDEDAPSFLDLDRTTTLIVHEHVMK